MTDATDLERYTARCANRVEPLSSVSASERAVLPVCAPEASAREAEALSSPERGGGAAAGWARQRTRTGNQQLQLIHDNLSTRDWRILQSLMTHPFLTTLQLQRLHFIDHASVSSGSRVCRRVLGRLAAVRAIQHLERRIGGVRAGSASFVWRLGPIGERLLRLRAGSGGPRLRRKEPSLLHLKHSLAIAEAHIRLVEASREHAVELLSLQAEPTCWRLFAMLGGGRAMLKPDLYAVTAIGDFEDSWFIEVDRGTESLPTLLQKCRQYEEYRRSGAEQRDHGVFPFVLWLLPDEQRKHVLTAALDKVADLDQSLYRIRLFDELVATVSGESA